MLHWSTVLRNVFSNWASYLVTALVGFLLAPLVVHSLGNTGYGLWTLVLSLTGYFGLLDLGIRSSVGRFVARYLALADNQNVNRTVNTSGALLSCAGFMAFLVTAVVAVFYFGAFKVGREFETAGRIALLISGLSMSCALPLGVFSSVLVALERFDVLSGTTIVGEITRAVLVVASLRSGYGLIALALIALFISVGEYAALGFFAKKLYPPLRLGFRFVDRRTLKDLFGFGIYRFIWIVANQLIFYSDALVIGIFRGAGAVTYYAIAGSLINYGRNIVSLLTDTFYPAATRMDARRDISGLQGLLFLATKITLLIVLPLCLGFIFLGKQFIILWMGNAYASSAIFLIVLTIPQFSSMSQYVSSLVLAGMAKHKVLAYFVLGEGVANLMLSIILVQKIGVIGVAWGTVIPDLVCTGLIVPFYATRILDIRMRDYIVKAYLRPLLCALPTAVIGYLFSRRTNTGWLTFAVEAATMCSVFGVMSWFFCFDPGERSMALARLGRRIQKETVNV